jgi:Flp pilus assembly pilin Flp
MVEYALILVLVSIVVIVILLTMGHQIANVFSNVVAALGMSGCNPGPGGGSC